ncbi:MAG: glycosyl hydrolase family 18 protein [Bacteroidota bacterium]
MTGISAIEGYPGHAYTVGDKQNFTSLIRSLRDTLGNNYEISFAAGGFDSFLQNSVEWDKIMPLLDKVNLMSYDLVSGYSKMTGHHTPLYSNHFQKQSADNASGISIRPGYR